MTLPHGPVATPTFMPVATQGTMKGVTNAQLEAIDPPISLSLQNTFHLSQRPGVEILDVGGGGHGYQGWRRNILTDSGEFGLGFMWFTGNLFELLGALTHIS